LRKTATVGWRGVRLTMTAMQALALALAMMAAFLCIVMPAAGWTLSSKRLASVKLTCIQTVQLNGTDKAKRIGRRWLVDSQMLCPRSGGRSWRLRWVFRNGLLRNCPWAGASRINAGLSRNAMAKGALLVSAGAIGTAPRKRWPIANAV